LPPAYRARERERYRGTEIEIERDSEKGGEVLIAPAGFRVPHSSAAGYYSHSIAQQLYIYIFVSHSSQ
jgi:hypothetical protein